LHLSLFFLSPSHILKERITKRYHVSEDKTEGRDVAPSTNSEERSDLENYKYKDKETSSTSNIKTMDFDSVTTVPTPDGILKQDDVEVIKGEMLENHVGLSRKCTEFYKLMQMRPFVLFFMLPL
jgi:hypothetical protein